MADNGKTQITATVPQALADRLERVADVRMVGKSLLVQKGLEHLLDVLERNGNEPSTLLASTEEAGR